MRKDCRRGSSCRNRVFLLWAVMLTLLLLCPVRGEAVFFFTKIADNNTQIPTHYGWHPFFWTFGIPVVDEGNVAFVGAGLTDWVGVVLHDGSVKVMADQNTSIPGMGSLKFGEFASPSIDSSNVAFLGAGSGSKIGVYVNVGGTLVKVADTNTNIPWGTGKFNFFFYAAPSADNDQVAFAGGRVDFSTDPATIHEMGVYTLENLSSGPSPLGVLADTSDTIPSSGNKTFGFFAYPSVSGASVAFLGSDGVQSTIGGIYTKGFSPGSISMVADTNTPISIYGGGGGTFAGFRPSPSYSGDNVAFLGCLSSDCNSAKGIYKANRAGSNPMKAVDTNTSVPGGTNPFTDLDSPSLDGDKLAFFGKSSGETGIYLYDFSDDSLTRVIRVGDKLDGRTVDEIGFGAEGLSGWDIGFRAKFTDGTQGIYRAEGPVVPWGSGEEPVPMGSSQWAPIGCTLCADNMEPLDPSLFSIAVSDSGPGMETPLWIDVNNAEDAVGYEYAVEGSRFASVTPPADMDPDNSFDLYVFDGEVGDFVDSGDDLTGGVPFIFSENGYDETNKFSIRGISMEASLSSDEADFLYVFPVGLTFTTEANTMVEITVTPVVQSGVPDMTTICSGLGNNTYSFVRDRDMFKFTGQEGEEITVSLEPDSNGSFEGERATLILKDNIKRFWWIKTDRSPLPKEMTVTLPKTGEYRIWVVEGFPWGRVDKFTGDYCLTLESSQDAWQTLEPTRWVE